MREWDQETPDIAFLEPAATQKIIWGGNYFKVAPSRCWLSWSKTNAVPTMSKMELAWTNFDKPSAEFRWPVGVHDLGHPTQKPLELFLWCLFFAPNANTILDPFAGSGTTGRAAKDLGKFATLIEREERYCEMAAKRMEQEVFEFQTT